MNNYQLSVSTGIGGRHGVFKRNYFLSKNNDSADSDENTWVLYSTDYDYLGRQVYLSEREICKNLDESIFNQDGYTQRQKLSELILTYDKELYNHSKHKNKNLSNSIIKKQLFAIAANQISKII